MIENQMVVGEVKEYAHDGYDPSEQEVYDWARAHKTPSEWSELFIDNHDPVVLGVCLGRLLVDEKGQVNYLMSKSDSRDISIASMLRAHVGKIVYKYWRDECGEWFDNGGEL